jgi:hypothetical protein
MEVGEEQCLVLGVDLRNDEPDRDEESIVREDELRGR